MKKIANSIIYSFQIIAGTSDEISYLLELFNQKTDVNNDLRFYIRARRIILNHFSKKETLDGLNLNLGIYALS